MKVQHTLLGLLHWTRGKLPSVCVSVCVCLCVCVYVKEREKEGKRELHYASSSQTYLELYNVTLSLYKPRQALMVPGG
jgi:hypothetical protein